MKGKLGLGLWLGVGCGVVEHRHIGFVLVAKTPRDQKLR